MIARLGLWFNASEDGSWLGRRGEGMEGPEPALPGSRYITAALA
jgi:hypothetical protein